MDNEIDKIKLMNGLLLSMPGSPSLYYGDEIGMGDNFFLGDRNGVRTPMQWSSDRNAGFSRADPQCLYLPPVMDPVYGFGSVNVEAQLRERGSLLNWMQRILALRKNHQAFGRGTLVFLHPGNRKILAYYRLYQGDIILCVVNLSRAAQAVELDLSAYKGCVPVELMGGSAFLPIGELPYLLTLPGHGYYWFKLASGEEIPAWHEEPLQPEELPTLVLFDGWNSFFPDRVVPWRIATAEKVRNQLEEEALPRFIAAQYWHAAKGEGVRRVIISDYAEWGNDYHKWLVALVSSEGVLGESRSIFLPLALAWENGDEKPMRALSPATVARVRQQAKIGILGDAFADGAFCRAVVLAIGAGQTLPCEQGTIRFSLTGAFPALAGEAFANLSVRPPGKQGGNTAVVLGEQLFLKGYRHPQPGIHPEFEVGRFLTDAAKFPNTPPVAGLVEYQGHDGNTMTLALLQGYIKNQGDGWSYTLDYLGRFLEECRTAALPLAAPALAHAAYLVLMRTLGQRTGELHNALNQTTGDFAFDPEPVTDADITDWIFQAQAEAVATLDQLKQREAGLPETVRETVKALLARRNALADRLNACISGQIKAVKTRYHGNYHLGQVLLAQNDFVITGFEGDSARPVVERGDKHSPLKDIAGMLRSFNYAAYTALAHATTERPMDSAKFEPLVRDWEAEAGRVFLAAYAEAIHCSGLFATDASLRSLLDLFLLEKALYEVRHELDSRPEWVVIPLGSILSLLESM